MDSKPTILDFKTPIMLFDRQCGPRFEFKDEAGAREFCKNLGEDFDKRVVREAEHGQ